MAHRRASSAVAAAALALRDGQRPRPGCRPDEGKELDGMQREIGRFEDAHQGLPRHRQPRRAAGVRRRSAATLMARYQAQLDVEEKDEKAAPRRRPSSCSRTSSPSTHNDDRWTPDAMFRLAELYFEKINDEYLIGDAGGAGVGRGRSPPDYRTHHRALQRPDRAVPATIA